MDNKTGHKLLDIVVTLRMLGVESFESQTLPDTIFLSHHEAEKVLDCVKTKAFFQDLRVKLDEILPKLDHLDMDLRRADILEIKKIIYSINKSDNFFDPNIKKYD